MRQSLDRPAPDSNSLGDPFCWRPPLAVSPAPATPAGALRRRNHDTTAQDNLQLTSGAALHLQGQRAVGRLRRRHQRHRQPGQSAGAGL
ncbi:hypothetical protein [Pseudomonas syringae]